MQDLQRYVGMLPTCRRLGEKRELRRLFTTVDVHVDAKWISQTHYIIANILPHPSMTAVNVDVPFMEDPDYLVMHLVRLLQRNGMIMVTNLRHVFVLQTH